MTGLSERFGNVFCIWGYVPRKKTDTQYHTATSSFALLTCKHTGLDPHWPTVLSTIEHARGHLNPLAIHTYLHTYILTYLLTYLHTYIHTHMYIYTHT